MDKLTQALIPPSRIDLAREADFTLGALRVRPSRREVEAGGVRQVLQRRVMQVLVALAHSTSQVVSQHELVLRCWSGLSVSDDAIGRCIAQLRRLADTWPEPPFEIVTIAGVGYRLEALAPTAPQLDEPSRLAPPALTARLRGWIAMHPRLLAASLVTGLAILAGVWVARSQFDLGEPVATPLVVVRPMTVIGGDPKLLPFAARVSDKIAGFLGASDVRVVTGPGARPQLAFAGSVSSEAGKLRLRLFLEHVPSHTTLWSRDFAEPRERADRLIDAAEGGAMETINVIRPVWGPSGLTLDPETTALSIQGAEDLLVPTRNNGADALREFQQALDRRPDFPGVQSAYAIALVAASATAPANEQTVMLARARAMAEKTIRDHPRRAALAPLALQQAAATEAPLDWAGNERRLDKVLEAAPEEPFANGNKCGLLILLGRSHESLYYCQRALSERPHTAVFLANYAMALDSLQNEEPQTAEPILKEAASLYPDFFGLRAYRFMREVFGGSPDKALQMLHDPDAALPLEPDQIRAVELLEKARKSGDRADGDAAIAAIRTADAHAPEDDFRYLFPMSLGRMDEAFAAPEAARMADRALPFLMMPFMEPLRRDPRWWPIAAKAGLVRYWLTTNKWPDFCHDPTYPLDCRAQARRVAAIGPA